MDDYIEKSIVKGGTWNYGFNRSDNPLVVIGHDELLTIQFDKQSQLTGILKKRVLNGSKGVKQYRIIAIGTTVSNFGGAFNPKLTPPLPHESSLKSACLC